MCSNDTTIPRSHSDTAGPVGVFLILLAALVIAVLEAIGVDV